MGWEVEGLKINVNDIVTIAKDYPVSYMTISVENLAEQYDYDAKIDQRAFMNTNANTHIIGTGSNANFNNAYRYVFGWTLPTDKTIYIQTDQNDGNVWFWWDGINIGGGSSFGNNSQYFRGISFPAYNDRGFNYSGSAINCYSTLTSKTIGDKIYYSQSTLGSRDTPYLYTTIPLSNFVINGERYDSNKSGGAGSGYIGNPLLSNKKMVGYNVPTSSAESTKTESVNEASETPTANKPKIGNGFARIKFLKTIAPPDEWKTEVEALKDFEIADKKFIHSDIPAGFDGDGFTNKGDYTYVCVSSSTNWQTTFNFSHIATIRVTTNSGGGYDVAYENLDHVYMGFQSHISMYGFGMCQLRTGSIDPYYFWPYNTITWQVSYEMATNQTHFDNLTNLFKHLNVHYRNINLYVDGECWALAGT